MRKRLLSSMFVLILLTGGTAACGGGGEEFTSPSSSSSTSSSSTPSETTTTEGSDTTEDSGDSGAEVWDNGVVELRVGDCYTALPVGENDPFDAEVVPCDSAHDGEVYGIDTAISPEAQAEAIAAYVGLDDPSQVSDWLTENNLGAWSNWDASTGLLDFLDSLTDGDLSRSYQASE